MHTINNNTVRGCSYDVQMKSCHVKVYNNYDLQIYGMYHSSYVLYMYIVCVG